MRTTRTVTTQAKGGVVSQSVQVMKQEELPEFLYDTLAGLGLETVMFTFYGGSSVTYTAWEYECEWCGSYKHKGEACPELEDHEEATDGIDCPNCSPLDRNDCIAPEGH